MNTQTMERPPLVKIAGTVASITLAEASNKPGKIELTSGKILRAFADKLQMVQEGGSYDFGCEPTEFRGVLNHTVRAVRVMAAAPTSATPQRAQPAQAAHGPVRQSDPIEQPRQEPPRPQPNGNGNGGQFYRPTSPKDARRMFICSQMNALITSHQVQPNAQSIADAIAMLSDAYDMTLGQEDQA